MVSHTATPSALDLGGGVFRIYFGTRDRAGHPRVGYIETNVRKRPLEVSDVSARPVLDRGPLGHFDDNGVYPGPIVEFADGLRMYYSGRSNGEPPLYYMSIGSAVGKAGGRVFEREFDHPVLTRGPGDPWMVTTPWVIRRSGEWWMWYTSGIGWNQERTNLISRYHVRRATSSDGLRWERCSEIAIGLEAGELNIASPTVLERDSGFDMWFSVSSGSGYRIGQASSHDGVSWSRRPPETGLELSSGDWDQDGIAYPHCFRDGSDEYMVYSGNRNGAAGLGLAQRL